MVGRLHSSLVRKIIEIINYEYYYILMGILVDMVKV